MFVRASFLVDGRESLTTMIEQPSSERQRKCQITMFNAKRLMSTFQMTVSYSQLAIYTYTYTITTWLVENMKQSFEMLTFFV